MMAWAKAKAAAIVVLISLFAAGGGAIVVKVALAQQQTNPPAADQGMGAADDHTAIQGTWQVVYQLRNGQPAPIFERAASIQTVITDKEMLTSSPVLGADPRVSYTIDPSHQPKWIDLTTAGRTQLGIYELDGDSLKICMATIGGSPRPTQISQTGRAWSNGYAFASRCTNDATNIGPGYGRRACDRGGQDRCHEFGDRARWL